ncbi:unnamed protein product, partial [marine sediment metagenome]
GRFRTSVLGNLKGKPILQQAGSKEREKNIKSLKVLSGNPVRNPVT